MIKSWSKVKAACIQAKLVHSALLSYLLSRYRLSVV